MNLTPREKDKLLIAMAAMVARRRLERGVKLNHPEAIALITDFVVEGARDGRSVAELMEAGRACRLRRSGDGRDRLDDPRHPGRGDFSRRHQARHRPPSDPRRGRQGDPRRGAGRAGRDRHERRAARRSRSTSPTPATGRSRSARTIISSRPIRRSSSTARRRKAIGSTFPAGTAVRFEPGQSRSVRLVAIAGKREVYGFRQEVMGKV